MRVLIVEDESVIRNGMQKHIKWKQYGIEEVYAASNADEAFAVCEEMLPDIVISDICMPGMNGIELCRRLRSTLKELEIIFVTGYEDKEYLKAAIALGVVGYVEKPIRVPVIEERISEAVRRVNETKKKKAACLYMFLQDCTSDLICTNDFQMFCAGMIHFRLGTETGHMKVQLSEELQMELEKQGYFFQAEKIAEDSIVFLTGRKEREGFPESLRKTAAERIKRSLQMCGLDWFLAFGSIADERIKITGSYLNAREAGRMLACLGWNQCVFFDDNPQCSTETAVDKIPADLFRDAVAQKNQDGARKVLDELFEKLIKDETVMNGDVKYLCYSMESTLDRAQKELYFLEEESEQKVHDFLETAETYREIQAYFRQRLTEIFDGNEAQKNHYLLNRAMEYIHIHYAEKEFSIQQLADYLYLTPTYLSALFKKSAGKTIGNYLLDVRVEKAKKLMRDPQLKFYHVAEMVGYEDANYFTKVFKKKTGLTPSDYKKSLELK